MKKYIIISVVLALIVFGTVKAATILFPAGGGTGTGTVPSNGELLIGNSGGSYDVTTLTAGSNITITNASGSITITGAAGGAGNPSGSDGQMQYNNGGVFGGSNMYYDSGNNRFALGDANPAAVLEVTSMGGSDVFFMITNNSDGDIFTVLNSGNVGIGTDSPNQDLHVFATSARAGIKIESTGGNDQILRFGRDSTNGWVIGRDNTGASTSNFQISYNSTGEDATFGTNDRFTIDSAGNVGIGDTSPDAILEVVSSGNNALFMISKTAGGDGDLFIIDNLGRVGIGINSPDKELHIHNSTVGSSSLIKFTNDSTGTGVSDGLQIGLTSGEIAQIWQYENDHFRIATNNIERIRIDKDGNLGINVTDPSQMLTIGSDDGTDRIEIFHDNSNAEINWDDGVLRFISYESANARTDINLQPQGTGLASYQIDGTKMFQWKAGNPDVDAVQAGGANYRLFFNVNDGNTKEFIITGFRAGDSKRELQIGVGLDADDTASFDGVSNYLFDGALKINSTDSSDQIQIFHDNTNAYIKWDDGRLRLETDEGTNTQTIVEIRGKGTGVGQIVTFDADDNGWITFSPSGSAGILQVAGDLTSLNLQPNAANQVALFSSAAEGETPELKISGRRTGDSKRTLEIGVGVDADDTVSFDGLSNYFFDGNVDIASVLTVTTATINSAYTLPTFDGNADQVMKTDGAGNLSWVSVAGGHDSVTLAGTPDYLTLSGQVITMTKLDISDDTNLTAGRSLTLSTNDVFADAELYQYVAKFAIIDPIATDDFFFDEIGTSAVTFTSIYCKTLVGTAEIDITIAGTDINGTDISCTTSGVLDSSLGGDTAGATGEEVKLEITSVASSPTYIMIILRGEYDD